jgi:hypothetical protein
MADTFYVQKPHQIIRQRRAQMLVHSYLYYDGCDTIVDDHQWQAWATELAELQRTHPAGIGFYDAEFADWDGSTGYHLPKDDWVIETAQQMRMIGYVMAGGAPPAKPKATPAPKKRAAPEPPPAPPPAPAQAPEPAPLPVAAAAQEQMSFF